VTLSWLALASVLLLPPLAGAGLAAALGLRFREDRLGFAGAAGLIGALATAGIVFVFLLAELPLEARFLAPALALAGGAGFALAARRSGTASAPLPAPIRGGHLEERLWRALLLALVLLLVARMFQGALHPIAEGDEGRIWARKARWLFRAGGFGPAFREVSGFFGVDAHLDYPLLSPLLQVWTFAHAGEVLHVENRFPIQVLGMAFVLALSSALRRRLRPGAAALVLVLVFGARTTSVLSQAAFSDGLLAFGLLVAVDGWLCWRAGGDPARWRLAALGLSCAVLTKNEGAFYLAALLAAFLVARLARLAPRPPGAPALALRTRLLGLLPFALLALTWGLNAWLGFTSDVANGSALAALARDPLARLATIARWIGAHAFVHTEQDQLLLAGWLVLVLAAPRRAFRGELGVLDAFLALVLAGYVAIYMLTPRDLDWHLFTSAERVFYQSLPVTALAVAELAARILPARLVGARA
jgi:hypothetical protein